MGGHEPDGQPARRPMHFTAPANSPCQGLYASLRWSWRRRRARRRAGARGLSIAAAGACAGAGRPRCGISRRRHRSASGPWKNASSHRSADHPASRRNTSCRGLFRPLLAMDEAAAAGWATGILAAAQTGRGADTTVIVPFNRPFRRSLCRAFPRGVWTGPSTFSSRF